MQVKVFLIYMKHALVGRKWYAKISARIQFFYKCNDKTECATVLLRRELRRKFLKPLGMITFGKIYTSYFQ